MSVRLDTRHSERVTNGQPRARLGNTAAELPEESQYCRVKRVSDCLLALMLLMVVSPCLILAALLVKLTSRGPAFYSQTRLGLTGKPFRIHKLRTMNHDCERVSGACWATADDPRVTWLGRILRKTHVDELPQLWNVIRGEMSLVGPRPERPELTPSLESNLPRYRERLQVRPGMTGLAQLQLPPDTDLTSVRRKLACDLHYVSRCGLGLDVAILLGTACYLGRVPFGVTSRFLRLPSVEEICPTDTDSEPVAAVPSPRPLATPAQ
jgi:lipopolysaccharide/colanic/teichoic acid biosynthesis glycosyltransferase